MKNLRAAFSAPKHTMKGVTAPLYVVAFVLSVVVAFTIAAMQVTYFQTALLTYMSYDSAFWLGGILGILLAASLYVGLPAAIRFILRGWVFDFPAAGASTILLIGAMWGYSFFTSTKGAPVIAELMRNHSDIIGQDSIFNQKEAAIQANITQAMNTKWKGSTTREGIKNAQLFNAELEAIRKDKAKVLAERAATSSKLSETSSTVAGVAEGALLLLAFTLIALEKAVVSDFDGDGVDDKNDSDPLDPNKGGKHTNNNNNTGRRRREQNSGGDMGNGIPQGNAEQDDEIPHEAPINEAKMKVVHINPEDSIKQAKSNFNAWMAKERNQKGTTETNKRNAYKFLKRAEELGADISDMKYRYMELFTEQAKYANA